MYQLFNFETRNNEVVGYHFPCENPNHVVCIIHGIGEYAGRYDRMAGYFKEAGIAALSMDLRGHGKSTGKLGHAAPRNEVFKDIDALLDYAEKMYPGVPVILYGHSMGGNLVLDYRARGGKNDVPEKYVVSAPWVELVRQVSGALLTVVKLCSKIMPTFAISSGCPEQFLGNLKMVLPYKGDPLVHDRVTMLCAYECFSIGNELAAGIHENNGRAEGKPFLLMHGTDDRICAIEGTRKVAKQYEGKPNFTYIEWPGYYHEIHNGGPEATGEEVIGTIVDFVKK